MTRKASDTDLENAVRDYVAGESAETCAARYRTTERRLRDLLRERGLFRDRATRYRLASTKISTARRARLGLDDAEIGRRYLAGESELALATAYGVSRNVIAARLRAAGIERRDGSAANRLRFADPAQRGIVARHAHLSMGKGERELADKLAARGYTVTRQLIVESYNIDLALPNIAIEVHQRSTDPLGPGHDGRELKRMQHLKSLGWHVIYVWIKPSHPLTDEGVDQIISAIKSTSRSLYGVASYRVILGTGELVWIG